MNSFLANVSDYPMVKGLIVVAILTVVGGFGGYLSAIQSETDYSGVQSGAKGSRRHWRATLRHIIIGAAGANIMPTLSVVDPEITNKVFGVEPHAFVKLIALGIIGGYAGSSLLDASASQYANKINENSEKINELEEKQKRYDEKTLHTFRTADKILRGSRLSEAEVNEFNQGVQETSTSARFEIATQADEFRRQNMETNKETLERSRLIFQALVGTPDADTIHRWHACLGYCLKDRINPDYAAAVKCFDTAIEIRGPATRSGAYEYSRAFCNIQLAPEQLAEQIRQDLEAAMRFPRFRKIIDNELTVQDWLRREKVGLVRKEARMHST